MAKKVKDASVKNSSGKNLVSKNGNTVYVSIDPDSVVKYVRAGNDLFIHQKMASPSVSVVSLLQTTRRNSTWSTVMMVRNGQSRRLKRLFRLMTQPHAMKLILLQQAAVRRRLLLHLLF